MEPSTQPHTQTQQSQQVVCTLCNNPPITACPGACQELLYCSTTCQGDDAPIHKLVCAQFASLPPKPKGKQILGVLFPENETTPQLKWIHIGGFADEESGISFHEPSVDSYFADDVFPEAMHSERNRVRNRDTRSMLEVWRVPPPKADGKEVVGRLLGEENQCIKALGGGKGAAGPFHAWRGPVLVLFMTRSTGFMVDPGAYRDCNLQDFGDAVDFVYDYGNDVHERRIKEALDSLGRAAAKEMAMGGERGGDGEGQEKGGEEGVESQETGKEDEKGKAENETKAEEGPKNIVIEMEA